MVSSQADGRRTHAASADAAHCGAAGPPRHKIPGSQRGEFALDI